MISQIILLFLPKRKKDNIWWLIFTNQISLLPLLQFWIHVKSEWQKCNVFTLGYQIDLISRKILCSDKSSQIFYKTVGSNHENIFPDNCCRTNYDRFSKSWINTETLRPFATNTSLWTRGSQPTALWSLKNNSCERFSINFYCHYW